MISRIVLSQWVSAAWYVVMRGTEHLACIAAIISANRESYREKSRITVSPSDVGWTFRSAHYHVAGGSLMQ